MANLQLIRDLAEYRRVSMIEVAKSADITSQGLHGAIKRGDIAFSSLDKISHYLGVDPSIFSEYNKKSNAEILLSATEGGKIKNSGVIGGSQTIGGNNINVSLPEEGNQKIINPDGSVDIRNSSSNENQEMITYLNSKIEGMQQTIEAQKITIESQKALIEMLTK